MQFCSIYDYMTITLLLEYTYVCIKCINIQLWNYWFGYWKANIYQDGVNSSLPPFPWLTFIP